MPVSPSLDIQKLRKNSALPFVGAAGAASAALIGAQTASAAPIYTPVNISVDSTHSATFDLNNDGVNDFVVEYVNGPASPKLHYADSASSPDTLQEAVYDTVLPITAAALPSGSLVGPSSNFDTIGEEGTGDPAAAVNTNTTAAALGVEFQPAGAMTPYYGYIAYEPTADGVQILGYAYESTAGDPITTTVPEPATLSVLALGAAGLLVHRKTRRA